nr:uncharacterized protein LOC123762358 [Procambarus clarkii]
MAEKLIMFLVTVTCLTGLSASFQYSDLVDINVACPPKDTCIVQNVVDSNDWEKRNCFCDDLCGEYGDCCLDAHTYNVNEHRRPGRYECVHLRQFGDLYMRRTCMSGWEDPEIAMMCLSGTPHSSSSRRDPLVDLPVTSLDSTITYTNFYCALCNKDSKSLGMWKARVECPTLSRYQFHFRNLTIEYVSSNLFFKDENWGLYIDDNGVEVFHTCFIDPVLPETVSHLVRPCKQMTKVCESDWTDTDVENLCHSYTAVVYNFEHAYRNPHCAQCNYVPKNYTCFYRSMTRFFFDDKFNPNAFSLLFDFVDTSGSNMVGSTSSCRVGQVFDPFFKKCRNVLCSKAKQEYRFGRCIDIDVDSDPAADDVSTTTSSTTSLVTSSESKPLDTTTEVSSDSSNTSTERTQTLTCEKFLLPASEFTMSANGTVVAEEYNRTFQSHEYEQTEGGVLICIIHTETDKFSPLMGWVSLAGLGLSCVCLILHLTAFFIVPDLRNLSGKNLASLCLVLLAAYTTFILSVFGEPGKSECFILAAALYYFLLSSFCWMNVMAFDIWRTLKLATSHLRVPAGRQWGKFLIYSINGWLMPAVALTVVVSTDLLRPDGLPPHYFPALGERWCWFGQRKALLVFFAAPTVTIMLINLVLFILSSRIIAVTTQSTTKITSCAPHYNQFKLYLRLALLMGLTWLSGVVAGYLQVEPVWYTFVLLNTLQGVFIFVAFTCTHKVWRVVSRKLMCVMAT